MTGTKGTGTRLLCAGAALTLGVLMPATASAQQSRSLSPGVQQFAPSGGPAASPGGALLSPGGAPVIAPGAPPASAPVPPGDYVVHVTFGLASAARTVHLKSDVTREVFEIPAGGLRMEGRVGDVRIPSGQISFDVFRGSQFEPGDKRAIASGIMTGDVAVLPEGTYHIVSNYGDSNSVIRSDIRVQTGRLTDVTVTHRAAVIMLKLVSERGGEALANTNWSVLTPGGDVIKESIGAFPKVILAEGDYRAIASPPFLHLQAFRLPTPRPSPEATWPAANAIASSTRRSAA